LEHSAYFVGMTPGNVCEPPYQWFQCNTTTFVSFVEFHTELQTPDGDGTDRR